MGGPADQFDQTVGGLQDRIQGRIDRLQERGTIKPLKMPDADILHLLQTLETDAEGIADFEEPGGKGAAEARRMETTARRLVREAGYALPETTKEVDR